jgi:hypothetical protein
LWHATVHLIPLVGVAKAGSVPCMALPEMPAARRADVRPLLTAQTAAVVRSNLREIMSTMEDPRNLRPDRRAGSGHQPVWRWPDLVIEASS